MADKYSFTTKVNENYFYRVLDEAPKSANFLLITDASTVDNTVNLVLFIKRETFDALAEQFPNERLLKTELGEWILARDAGQLHVTEGDRFYAAVRVGLDRELAEKEALSVRNELKRLQNIIDGRTVRVTVENF